MVTNATTPPVKGKAPVEAPKAKSRKRKTQGADSANEGK